MLFTDGAAIFVKSEAAFTLVGQMALTPGPSGNVFGNPAELDKVFDVLEQ